MADDKPTLVRIKRKRCDEPVDVLWLERGPESKRQECDVAKLRLDDDDATKGGGRTFFRRLQTVAVSQVKDASLSHSLMSELSQKSDKQAQRREGFKKVNKPEASAKEQHEKMSHTARYKQVWRNRLGNQDEDAMHQFFQLYDVERADEEQKDNELLMKYMPLLREHSPERFGGKDEESTASAAADDFVYDVYAQDEERDSDDGEDLLTLQVSQRLDYGTQEELDSDYDSEDSNRENHPDCEYPDEEEDEDDTEDDADADEDDSDDDERWRRMRR